METCFILVEPQSPGNIGASARAINTMGYDRLRLVAPCDPLHEEACWMAHGSREILERAVVFDSLAAAVADCDFVVATTARHRKAKTQYVPLDALPALLAEKQGSVGTLAIVFGRESSGLTNEELVLCDAISSVATVRSYPALNLSQAVMLYAYTLATGTRELLVRDQRFDSRQADPGEYEQFKSGMVELLREIDLLPSHKFYRRVMQRISLMGYEDLHLAYFLKKKLLERLGRPGS